MTRVSPSDAVAANDGLTGNPAHEYDQLALGRARALQYTVHTLFLRATAGSRLFAGLERPWREQRHRRSPLWVWLVDLTRAPEPSPAWSEGPPR